MPGELPETGLSTSPSGLAATRDEALEDARDGTRREDVEEGRAAGRARGLVRRVDTMIKNLRESRSSVGVVRRGAGVPLGGVGGAQYGSVGTGRVCGLIV